MQQDSQDFESIPTFIINLKDCVEKRRHISELCQRYNLKTEFVDAVYGKKLTEEELAKIYRKDLALKRLKRELSKGEIGCALSHKKIYQHIVDKKIELALILEDDVFFRENPQIFLKELIKERVKFPAKWEIILLGHHSGSRLDNNTIPSIWSCKKLKNGYCLGRTSSLAYGTYGYLINQRGARRMLKNLFSIYLPLDRYTGDSRYTNFYCLFPPLIVIDEQFNLIENIIIGERSRIVFNSKRLSLKEYIVGFLGLRRFKKLRRIKAWLCLMYKKIKPLKIY